MKRVLAVLTVAIAASFAFAPATFAGKSKKPVMMSCKAKSASGKKMKWKCAPGSTCCVNGLTGEGVCGTPGLGCL
jgi:uncharacterized low-complexity protein